MSLWNVFGKKKSPQELMAAGNYKGALKAVDEILASSKKKDPAMLLVRADIHLRMGNNSEARKGYIAVGEFYGDAGFFNKAVAVFKKALNITPNDKEILNKLASYNNKVPKYILDSSFLAKATGEPPKKSKQPTATEEPPTISLDGFPADLDQEPLPEPIAKGRPGPPAETAQDTTSEFDTADYEVNAPDFDTADHMEPVEDFSDADTDPHLVQPAEEAEAEDLVGDGIDFDTLSDLSEELSAEFEKPFMPPIAKAPPPLPELPSPKPQQPEATASSSVPKTTPPPRTASPEGMPIGGGIVFSTRPSELDRKAQSADMDFSSLDDALDNLFATEPAAPEPAPREIKEANGKDVNSRHWALFRTMPEDTFLAFVVALEGVDYGPGENIVQQGGIGDTMFLIADGTVDILIEKDEGLIRVASLGEGDFFGEASLLTGQPRNATVQATSPTSCLLLTKEHLDTLAVSHPSIIDSIQTIYAMRSKQNAGG